MFQINSIPKKDIIRINIYIL